MFWRGKSLCGKNQEKFRLHPPPSPRSSHCVGGFNQKSALWPVLWETNSQLSLQRPKPSEEGGPSASWIVAPLWKPPSEKNCELSQWRVTSMAARWYIDAVNASDSAVKVLRLKLSCYLWHVSLGRREPAAQRQQPVCFTVIAAARPPPPPPPARHLCGRFFNVTPNLFICDMLRAAFQMVCWTTVPFWCISSITFRRSISPEIKRHRGNLPFLSTVPRQSSGAPSQTSLQWETRCVEFRTSHQYRMQRPFLIFSWI